MIVSILARIAGVAVSLYMLLCTARVFLTWIPSGQSGGRWQDMLRSLVDPYFALFSRFRFLRTPRVDFSPIAALGALSVLNGMLGTLARTGALTVGFVLALVLGVLWSAVGFVLSFLSLLALARIVAFFLKVNSFGPVWMAIDSIINPALHAINRVLFRNRPVQYLHGLLAGFLVLAVMRAAGGALVGLLSTLLRALPF
jgi:YggT family protein